MPADPTKGVASPTHGTPSTDGQRRQSRSGSVVFPEATDQGKPKLFARQSFVVSGDDEMMAETILEARKLAMERRRSVADDGGVHPLARRASADSRRSSANGTDHAAAAATATAAHAAASVSTGQEGGDAPSAATARDERRRSSVIHKLPASLRALMQQSDENGIQQKCENPFTHQLTGVQEAEDDSATTTTIDRDDVSTAEASTASGTPPAAAAASQTKQARWCSSIMNCFKSSGSDDEIEEPKKEPAQGTSTSKTAATSTATTPAASSSSSGSTSVSTKSTAVGTGSPKNGSKTVEPVVPASLLPPQRAIHSGRKLLVLDLDETLVHSSFKPVSHSDYILDIVVDSTSYKVYVLKRPGVDEFLERVAKDYEVIIFTASLPQYANPLLDILDPKRFITARLFREHCTFHEGYFVKDLTMLRNNMDLTDTIIVDNSPMAYMFQPDNAIDCTSWLEDGHDEELYVIADFLEKTKDVSDVRDYVEFWREGADVISEGTPQDA